MIFDVRVLEYCGTLLWQRLCKYPALANLPRVDSHQLIVGKVGKILRRRHLSIVDRFSCSRQRGKV
jgi:hypothetical protein